MLFKSFSELKGLMSNRVKGTHLANWKREQAIGTGKRLEEALDRFRSGKLINLPKGAKLTRLSLAQEAGVAEDTTFSRFRKGHPQVGEYRFPEAVKEFNSLRDKLHFKKSQRSGKEEIAKLKRVIKELERSLSASRIVTNAQDIKISKLEASYEQLLKLYSTVTQERDNLEAELNKLRRRRIKEA